MNRASQIWAGELLGGRTDFTGEFDHLRLGHCVVIRIHEALQAGPTSLLEWIQRELLAMKIHLCDYAHHRTKGDYFTCKYKRHNLGCGHIHDGVYGTLLAIIFLLEKMEIHLSTSIFEPGQADTLRTQIEQLLEVSWENDQFAQDTDGDTYAANAIEERQNRQARELWSIRDTLWSLVQDTVLTPDILLTTVDWTVSPSELRAWDGWEANVFAHVTSEAA